MTAFFKEYESFDEMVEDVKRAEDEAINRAAPWQHRMSQEAKPAYAMRPHVEEGEFILIVSEFPTYKELREQEISLGASESEANYGNDALLYYRSRGYMYGKHYSVIVPDGEWGSAHVSTLIPISRATFDFFRERGWTL